MDEGDASEALCAAIHEEPFAQVLPFEVTLAEPGRSVVEMTTTDEMQNIHKTIHGGVTFALIDEAFEVAANAYGTTAVGLNCNLSYVAPAFPGDRLRAEAKEISRSRRVATYDIRVTNQDGKLLAVCHALAYRKGTPLPFLEETVEDRG